MVPQGRETDLPRSAPMENRVIGRRPSSHHLIISEIFVVTCQSPDSVHRTLIVNQSESLRVVGADAIHTMILKSDVRKDVSLPQ